MMQSNRVLNAAKPGHSADPVSAVTKKGKTLLGVEHPIVATVFLQLNLERQSKAGFQKINDRKSITVNKGHKKGFAVSDGAA